MAVLSETRAVAATEITSAIGTAGRHFGPLRYPMQYNSRARTARPDLGGDMAIDWVAAGSWLQGLAGFAQAGAITFVGFRGADVLLSWKRQKIAERRFETAERIITLAYRVRRAFSAIRSGMMWGNETAAAERLLRANGDWFERLDREQQKTTAYSQAVLTRINLFSSEWDELIAALPIARTYFGDALEQQLQSLWQQRGRVSVAAEMYADDRGEDKSFSAGLRRDLWEPQQPAENEVTQEINSAFAAIESILRPTLNDVEETGRRVRR